ncbi:hypothetical protein VCHE16_0989 [Vibrio paracholerae HE-16]|nr:hypothetical protein VCHE16_0989 [Vibrio paracholerae HE-16]
MQNRNSVSQTTLARALSSEQNAANASPFLINMLSFNNKLPQYD